MQAAAIFNLLTLILAFPVCTPYEKKALEEDENVIG